MQIRTQKLLELTQKNTEKLKKLKKSF